MFLVVCGLMAFAFTATPVQYNEVIPVAEASGNTIVDKVPIGKSSDMLVLTSTPVRAYSNDNYYTGRHIDVEIPPGYFKIKVINVVGSNNHSATYVELARNMKHGEYREFSKETYLVRIPDLGFPSRILGLTFKEM